MANSTLSISIWLTRKSITYNKITIPCNRFVYLVDSGKGVLYFKYNTGFIIPVRLIDLPELLTLVYASDPMDLPAQ